MNRPTRNYLIRRFILGPFLRVTTHGLALVGLICRPLSKSVIEPIFIVGCSRSGTTLFAEIFGARNDLCNVMDAAQTWDLNYYDKSGDDHRDENDAGWWETLRLRSSLGLHVFASGGKRLVNKNNQNSLRLRLVKAVFPDAFVVHVVRDARPVVLSNLSRLEKDPYRRRFPFGRFPKPVAWRSYMDLSPLEQFACQWRDLTACIREDGHRLFGPERYFEIKFEEFCADPASALSRIDAGCGLTPRTPDPAISNLIASGDSDAWRDRLAPDDVDRIMKIAGPQLNVLGYSAGAGS